MAAGTAMYEALAAKTEKMNWSPRLGVNNGLSVATIEPFTKGKIIAKAIGNHP